MPDWENGNFSKDLQEKALISHQAAETFVLLSGDGIPNSPLPLLLLKQALPRDARSAEKAEQLLRNAGWTGTWTYTVFPFWHFHSKGHEVLACVAGEALIGFGGNGGVKLQMSVGDAVVIPAGVGHKRIDGTVDFQVAGAYPPGQEGDIVRPGELDTKAIGEAIAALPLPQTDPLTGESPGALVAWHLPAA